MQIDPVAEWQRLTEFYRAKGDQELEELAEDFGNLTETAQQVLTTELRSRGLSMPGRNPQQASFQPQTPRDTRFASMVDPDVFRSHDDDDGNRQYTGIDGDSDEDAPHEFTWKTPLCACDEQAEAWQIHEVLRRAGIESWIERKGERNIAWDERMVGNIQVIVAADQLDEAREIAARPIPRDIVEESKDLDAPQEEYVPPKCPKCRAEDPVLEGADPSNSWLCEACGARWSDPLPELDPKAASDPTGPPK
jgi:hypothetical protein